MNFISRFTLTAILLSLLSVVGLEVFEPRAAFSQALDKLSIEERRHLAEQMGLQADHPRFIKFLENINNPDRFNPEKQSDIPIIKHLKGQAGTALPPFQVKPKAKTRQISSILPAQIGGDSSATSPDNSEENKEQAINNLIACKSSKREIIDWDIPTNDSGAKLVDDFLFIDAADINKFSLNFDELFGVKTIVRVVDNDDSEKSAAIAFGITCLPSRIRVTQVKIFQEQGAYALQNYDKDQHGEGELHENLQELASNFK